MHSPSPPTKSNEKATVLGDKKQIPGSITTPGSTVVIDPEKLKEALSGVVEKVWLEARVRTLETQVQTLTTALNSLIGAWNKSLSVHDDDDEWTITARHHTPRYCTDHKHKIKKMKWMPYDAD
jgi:hypothetical protein